MIRNYKLPQNIEAIIPRAADYLAAHPGVIFAYLFGSLAKQEQRPLSDVDISIFLKRVKHPTVIQLEILGKLNQILKTDEIDLVILNTAPLMLSLKVLQAKKLLVDKDPHLRHRYESLTLREGMDFSIFESTLLRRRFSIGRRRPHSQKNF